MPLIRAQVILNKLSGIPADAVTNKWDFHVGSAVTSTDYDEIHNRLVTFYNAINGLLGQSLAIAANSHRIKQYLFADDATVPSGSHLLLDPITPMGPPKRDATWTLTNKGNGQLPAECAAVLTFEAGSRLVSEEVGATRPASRRRGRVYIGPLHDTVKVADGVTGEQFILGTSRTTILTAAQALQSGLAGLTNPIAHVVFSGADNSARVVTDYSMNDEFDTMRKRGPKAKTRVRVPAVAVALGA